MDDLHEENRKSYQIGRRIIDRIIGWEEPKGKVFVEHCPKCKKELPNHLSDCEYKDKLK